MKKFDLILLMAGSGKRCSLEYNKVLYQVNKIPLFMYSLMTFENIEGLNKIYLVVSKDDYYFVQQLITDHNYQNIELVLGGPTRNTSVKNALKEVKADLVLIHDSARPLISKEDINELIKTSDTYLCGTIAHYVVDTIKNINNGVTTVDRDKFRKVSTPQFFSHKLYKTILDNNNNITDEIQLFENKIPIAFVIGTNSNIKVTNQEDLSYIEYVLTKNQDYLIGHSFDLHQFDASRKLFLGGIEITTEFGLKGWSDADVVYHVVTESILGALGMGDIGLHFPDNDEKFHNLSSIYFVNYALDKMKQKGYRIKNIDIIIYLEKPNLKNYKHLIASNLHQVIGCEYINVKATTMEKYGLIGSGAGIAAEAVTLLIKN